MKYKWMIIWACLISFTGCTGCTGHFESLNTDPTKLSEMTPPTVGSAFARTQYEGLYGHPGIYQLARNLFVDYYCQYFAARDPGIRTDRYAIVQDWIISQWSSVYTVTWATLKLVLETTEDTDPEAHAIAKIWKVFVFLSNTDYYGPIPYSQAAGGQTSIPYDSQQAIYDDFFKLLDDAVGTLDDADKSRRPFGTNDLIYQGDINQWIRFASTLRLRLALRISFVDPGKAKQEAEKAVADGVMESNDENAFLEVNENTVNGLNVMSDWGEYFVMSATMESYLKGYSDPRMPEYFRPAENDGQFHGIRNGLTGEQLNSSPKNAFGAASNVGPRYDVSNQATTPLSVMVAAEAWFLRAEGALNGWNMGGTPQALYEQGISTSIRQWGITSQDAIQNYINNTHKPAALNDYLNSPPVSDLPVKFESTAERQRQQIATQKWLALYPDGIEAWAEARRTGYPVLYPVANSDNPDIPAGQLIRRIPYLDFEKQTNAQAVQEGVKLLGGPDKPTTRLWWDVK